MALQKIVRELENVGAPLAERRYAHVDTAQPVEQVRAKDTSLDEFGQPPVGCRDDSNVDAMRAASADPLHGEILYRAQQLRLRWR